MKHGLLLFILALALPLAAQSAWQTVTAANITFEYRVSQDSQELEGKLTGQTTGWIAVGFNPTSVMRNSNFIIGYVSGGSPAIRDDWGNTNTSHVSDTSLGGTSNVTVVNGTEVSGTTMLHFSIPLNSGDQYDRVMVIGQSYPIILAKGANGADNYTGMHTDAGFAQINLIGPVSNDDPLSPVQSGLSAWPNPFRGSTTLRFSKADATDAVLSVYNTRGQLIERVRINGGMGEQELVWSPAGLTEGIYLLRLQSSGGVSSGRVTVLRR